MDEYTANAFVNRDDPVPVVNFEDDGDISNDNDNDVSTEEGGVGKKYDARSSLRMHLSKANMKDTLQKATGKSKDATHSVAQSGKSMQDRLLEKLLQQVIPVEDMTKNRGSSTTSAEQSFVERPGFNITTMSNNFRRFNSRIGVVFVFQAKMIRLMSWKTWSHTLSFLAVYTFVCLDPYLLSVLPLCILLLAVLIPAFMTRHPAPPTTLTFNAFEYTPGGPPIAPAPTVKPVKELSKDFFRNMRDLQNCMEDFSRVHDKIISILTPPTNFSNEALSSTLFLFLFMSAATLFIASRLVPWRLIFLVVGWVVTCMGHPKVQRAMVATHKEHIVPREEQAKTWLHNWVASDIILDSEPEKREVEIFELQRRTSAGEWESWIFCPSPYDPMSKARISDERPQGTRFFEDVQPPRGWEWSDKKWALDLWSREWVEERIITGVEVETEGERWVYDIEYGNGEVQTGVPESPVKGKGKASAKLPSWEEGSGLGSREKGDWRRRRWVRMVKRRDLSKATDD